MLANKAKEMADKYGKKVDTFTDFRKLLERKDIDAVSIATPNHIHAWVTVRRGPGGQGRVCREAGVAQHLGRPADGGRGRGRTIASFKCGTQSRSSQSLKEAVEWVQGGGLGKILYAIGTCYKPRQSIGKLDTPLEIPEHDSLRPVVRPGGEERSLSARSCTTIGIGIGTPATATWATRASIRWISPAGSWASRRSRRG